MGVEEEAEGGVGEKEGEEIGVEGAEFLAGDGGVLAALDEQQGRVPAEQVFDHPLLLPGGQLVEAGGGEAVV